MEIAAGMQGSCAASMHPASHWKTPVFVAAYLLQVWGNVRSSLMQQRQFSALTHAAAIAIGNYLDKLKSWTISEQQFIFFFLEDIIR